MDEGDECVQDFVLEIAMAEKSKVLPELAQSYIERGTRLTYAAGARAVSLSHTHCTAVGKRKGYRLA